jgi:hypothetical protein
VLGVTALGPDFGGAREHPYTAVDRIAWPGDFCHRDIAARAEFARRREDTAKIGLLGRTVAEIASLSN